MNWRQWDTQMCGIMPKESLTGLLPVYRLRAHITINLRSLTQSGMRPELSSRFRANEFTSSTSIIDHHPGA